MRECGIDEAVIEQIRTDDRADFNSNRRFYRWARDFGEYLESIADREKQAEVRSVSDLLDEIESENLYLALITVDRRTLQIVLLRMQGYSTKEIAPLVFLSNRGQILTFSRTIGRGIFFLTLFFMGGLLHMGEDFVCLGIRLISVLPHAHSRTKP